MEKDGRTLVVPDSYTLTESSPVGFFNIFTSIHTGMIEGAGIIFFILIIGGAFGILKATGALDALIVNITRKLANRELLLIPVLMMFFAVGGALMGMAEETLVYVAIITPVAIALKLDAIILVVIQDGKLIDSVLYFASTFLGVRQEFVLFGATHKQEKFFYRRSSLQNGHFLSGRSFTIKLFNIIL